MSDTRPQTQTGDQWLRWISLRAGPKAGGDAVDLSELRIVFRVASPIISTPNSLTARVYNLSNDTVGSLLQFNPPAIAGSVSGPGIAGAGGNTSGQVILDAGYQNGQRGNIFIGDIVQVRAGRENQTDTYVDIYAQDTDAPHLWSVLNTTLAKGHTHENQRKAISDAFQQQGAVGSGEPLDDGRPLTPAPRGKPMYGMARDHASDLARNRYSTWTFDKGQLLFIPYDKYRGGGGEAIVVNPATGMIGMPELTQAGVQVRCLLNPAIGMGTRIKLDDKVLTSGSPGGPAINLPAFNLQFQSEQANLLPGISASGVYKVLVTVHSGDTRGNPWYSDIICISIDETAVPPLALTTGIPP